MFIPFDNSFVNLGETFFARQLPTPVKKPGLIAVNKTLADYLNINPEDLVSDEGVEVLAGNNSAPGSEPIATVYAGHQFGHWNPQLGDGRAILLGEVVAKNGCRYDIQLKGAGVTPYSRMGDGRSPLGPVLREYVVSEAMAALGVPTTRSLAAVTTGEQVVREGLLPGAILTRVAQSHIRIGSFQYFASQNAFDAVKQLLDHVITRHFPEIEGEENSALAFFDAVIVRQAQLIAHWQSIGFIHGVMNTDNMLVSGETIDYGPCAFMDEYHPGTVFSSIDRDGRYAYANQPGIAKWNLAALAQALLPLINDSEEEAVKLAQESLNRFDECYTNAYEQRMANKLGFAKVTDAVVSLLTELLKIMADNKLDFTLSFRALTDSLSQEPTADSVSAHYQLPDSLNGWLDRWQSLLENTCALEAAQQTMRTVNSIYIPRNHLVEEVITIATNCGDFKPFHDLVAVLEKPFEMHAGFEKYLLPPKEEQRVRQTFCGT